MNIKLQIITLVVSFFYGIFFSFFLSLNYKFIYSDKKIFKTIISFLVVIINALLYFIILRKINYGIFHIYEILALILGFIIENWISTIIAKRIKKWYNLIIGEWLNGKSSTKSI